MKRPTLHYIFLLGIAILVVLFGVLAVRSVRESRTPDVEPRVAALTDEERVATEARLAEFRPMLESDSNNVGAAIEVARAEHLLGRSDEAIRILLSALERRPTSTNLRADLASIYRDLGKPRQAFQLYDGLLDLKPTISVPYIQYMNLVWELDPKNRQKVEEIYERGKAVVTVDLSNLHRAMAGYYTGENEFALAIAVWEEVQRLEPDNADIAKEITELRTRLEKK